MSYLLMGSVQGNLILEGLKLYVCQLVLLIRGAHPYQKVNGSLLRLLTEILDGIPLLPEGEGPTLVFPQHLEESG